MSIFSNNLKSLRESHGWSKTYLAKKLNISMQTYANWEYGNREPRIEMVNKLAKIFNVSTDYLLGHNKSNDNNSVDLKNPVVLSYGGKPVSDEDMEVIKAILERHNDKSK